jgi:hypothetical protein
MTEMRPEPEQGRRKGLTDQQADIVAILVIMAAVIGAVIHFLTGPG